MQSSSRPPVLVVVLALAAATIACIGAAPGGAPTEAASFATVTPGGRISISLLNATQPARDLLVQEGTPIGPVATGTAAAAAAFAQTQSAPAPTATIAGLLAPPAECPEPGNPRLPAQPPTFGQFDEVMAQYLSGGGAATVIEGRLAAWGAIADYGGLIRADRDFTGDSVPEVLAILLDPAQQFPYPGDLYIFGCDAGQYRLLYQAGHSSNRSAPLILNYNSNDVNANGLNDLVYGVQTCDERICTTSVEVVEWNQTLNSFDSLLARDINEPFAEVQVTDLEGDGLSEIVVTSGTAASEGAGPQPSRTTTLRWDGARYAIADQQPNGAQYRIHVIHEADAALKAGDPGTAAALYRRAINEDSLRSWSYPDEAAYLRAYSRYRLMLTHVAQGSRGEAQAAYEALLAAYTTQSPAPPPATGEGDGQGEGEPTVSPPTAEPTVNQALPGSGFAEMARLFWRSYSQNGDAAGACQLVTGYARSAPSSYEVLNSFGYSNPTYPASDLCPLGG